LAALFLFELVGGSEFVVVHVIGFSRHFMRNTRNIILVLFLKNLILPAESEFLKVIGVSADPIG
jgi:hypothetical protein